MKNNAIVLVTLLALLMSGCLVTSIHPFYKAKDKVYDPSIAGTYIDGDSCIWVIKNNMVTEGFMSNNPERPDSTFEVKYYEDKASAALLQATLFELDGQRYVDFFPQPDEDHFSSDMTGFHHVPVHTLARVQMNRDTLMLFWFGEEWLNDLFENNRIRIDHEKIEYSTYESNLLTAGTDDLQKFIRKYMNEEKTLQVIENAFDMSEDTDDHVFLKLYPYGGPIPEEKAKIN